MPSYFPCPNAQCNYQFDADILPAAAMVTCPLCRTRFPYRAAQPVAAAGPGGAVPEDLRTPAHRLICVREIPQGGGIWTTVLWVVGFCVVLAAVVATVLMRGQPQVETSKEATDAKFNIKVEPFPSPWEGDVNAQITMECNILGRKRTGPDAWVAVAAQDWVDRQPRAAELDDLMISRIKRQLSNANVVVGEPQTWAGQTARMVQFSGNVEDLQVR